MWGPGEDSDDEVEEEDLIQEYGLLPEPMDTSSDDPSQMSISQQQAFEVRCTPQHPPAAPSTLGANSALCCAAMPWCRWNVMAQAHLEEQMPFPCGCPVMMWG